MDNAEKREILKKYCKNRDCAMCKLNLKDSNYWKRPNNNANCLRFCDCPEEDLDKALVLIGYVKDPVNRPTIKKIRELNKSEVIPAIVNNETVLRINLEKMLVCNLENKSISTIRNDFKKDCYLYLIVEDWREAI